MTDTFDNRLQRVPVYVSAPEDLPGPEPEAAPSWYSRAGNALLGVLDQFGVAGLPEGPRREAAKEARNKLLHIGPMEEQDYLWPEKMLRSAVTLAGDMRTGNVPPPGLRREDYTDIPADPSKVGGTPHDDLIQRVQDMAGLAMTGGWAGTGSGGKVLGSGATMPSHQPISVARHFKDVAYPHAKMERGDWARFNRAVENGDHVEVDLPLRSLNATQKTVNPDFMSVRNDELPAVMKKGGEYYVQDGHHRLMREAASGKQTARVRLYDVDPSTKDPRQLTLLSGNNAAAPIAALEHLTTGQLDDAARAVAGRKYEQLDRNQQQRAQELALETVYAKNEAAAPLAALEKRGPVWYSPVEHALEQSTQGSATGAQWLATIRNSRGVKPEELDWTGLRQFLEERADKPVTRPELHEYLRDNRVELQDVTKGGHKDWTQEDSARLDDLERRRNDLTDAEEAEFQRLVDRENNASEPGSSPEITKYQSYQLPGGENYREHLITMPIQGRRIGVRPSEEGPLEAYDTATGRTVRNSRGDDNEMLAWAEAENKKGQPTDPREYMSPHWGEPNIVAHVRSNVREMQEPGGFVLRNRNSGNTTRAFKTEQEAADHLLTLPEKLHGSLDIVPSDKPIKKRSLHLEEVQSDWHQAGRRGGYQPDTKTVERIKSEADAAEKKIRDVFESLPERHRPTKEEVQGELVRLRNGKDVMFINPDNIRDLIIDYQKKYQEMERVTGGNAVRGVRATVPDAPWKKTWHELALRRMVRLAAEEGMDRISWTPGEAQAARYDLSKSIDRVLWSPEGEKLMAFDKNGRVLIEKQVKKEELPDVIGKEAADKLVNKPTRIDDLGKAKMHSLENADLKVGGEGMRGFYDKMMVHAAEKLGREYGVKVQAHTLDQPVQNTKTGKWYFRSDNKLGVFDDRAAAEKAAPKVWYFDIPPAMREAALGRGMPLFSGGKMFVPSGAQRAEEGER